MSAQKGPHDEVMVEVYKKHIPEWLMVKVRGNIPKLANLALLENDLGWD